MSLINQMLQDLEQREGAPPAPAEPGLVRAVARPHGARRAWWWAVPLLLAIGAGGWLLIQQAPPPMRIVAPPPAQTAPHLAAAPLAPSDAEVGTLLLQSSLQLSTPAPMPVKPPSRAQHTAPPHPVMFRVEPSLSVAHVPAVPASIAAKPQREEPVAASAIDKRLRELSPPQQAEAEYRKALAALQQGRIVQASSGLEHALQLDPHHVAARQTLVGLLVEGKRYPEAEQQLRQGLQSDPEQSGFAASLARLQVERGAAQEALETLQRSLPYAAEKADYRAFMAALLQRLERHKEAVEHYQAALRHAPQSGLWLMGLGISLQADNRPSEARDAYNRARASGTLTPELQAFVEQRLRQLP